MTRKRLYARAVLGSLMLLCAAQPAVAAPEPLVVTPMADPDPNFVPPPPERKQRAKARRANSDEHPTLDQAFENLGRVAGQAAQIAEQRAHGQTAEQRASAEAEADRLLAEAKAKIQRARQSAHQN